MKIKVSPTVLAAALGLLGPAALEDSFEQGVMGAWKKLRAGVEGTRTGALQSDIQLFSLEDDVMVLDNGPLDHGAVATWTTVADEHAVQELEVDGARIVRAFHADGDLLRVDVRIERDGQQESWSEDYERV